MFNWLTDLIFPYRCIVCQRYLSREYLCRSCFNVLPIKKQGECIGCERPTSLGKTCVFCKSLCSVDQLLVVSDYKNLNVAKTIKLFKYHFLSDLAEPIGRLIFKYIDQLAKKSDFSIVRGNPLVIPVPLFKTREYSRGFNQSELLATLIAIHYRLDMSKDLIRIGNRDPQVNVKNRLKRLSNVHNLYSCSNQAVFSGRTIILIDDVCTTGATLNECARTLKSAGAENVIALVVARG
jgi:competence protein ComFC